MLFHLLVGVSGELLSGGERRPVKIGRAVESKNRVIIMDKPTNHLSVREREHVNEIAQQQREQGLLVIYITQVADVQKHQMTAKELEHIIRDGGRQVGEAAA